MFRGQAAARSLAEVHTIVNQQRTDMMKEIAELKQARVDRDIDEFKTMKEAAVETAKRVIREAAEEASELVRQAAKDVLKQKQP